MSTVRGDITVLLLELQAGSQDASARLMELVYSELRRMAGAYMKCERLDHTLQPTALVHEAYLRLLGNHEIEWHDRVHFLAIAANAMRRILVEYARARNAGKRGGGLTLMELPENLSGSLGAQVAEVLDLDRALSRLAEFDPRLSRIVELRYFGGLTVEATAAALEISPKTVKRDWAIAKAWLREQLDEGRVK